MLSRMVRISSSVSSRASTMRSAPISTQNCAASLLRMLVCVLMCSGSCGTTRFARRMTPRSETMIASAPQSYRYASTPCGGRAKKSALFFVIPLLAGLAVGHAFIPPTPGPVLVANILGVDLGLVIGLGLVCGFFAMILAGPMFGKICGQKFNVPVPDQYLNAPEYDESKLPTFGSVVSIIMIPLFLILINSVLGTIPQGSAVDTLRPVFAFLGTPFIALLLATIAAMFLLGVRHGYSREELEKVMTKSLEPTGLILLVTAGGGVLRYMLQDSGLGDIIGNTVAATPLPIVVVAFLIALAVRISVGSATVAMTMAAGIVASMPMVATLSQLHLACLVMAIAGGSTAFSHFNDSGFWLVKSLCNLDEKTTFKTWTMMETIVGTTGFVAALIISFFA